jgi:hypothetical protein
MKLLELEELEEFEGEIEREKMKIWALYIKKNDFPSLINYLDHNLL